MAGLAVDGVTSLIYFVDRILIRMDPGWTQFNRAYFGSRYRVMLSKARYRPS
jgi:hypothetical protein